MCGFSDHNATRTGAVSAPNLRRAREPGGGDGTVGSRGRTAERRTGSGRTAGSLRRGAMKKLRSIVIAPVVGILILAAGVVPSSASSHREAPLTAADPQIDSTDLYAFVSPDAPDSVTLISNWIPFESPSGGPNFYPWAQGVRYDINVDNNGDA